MTPHLHSSSSPVVGHPDGRPQTPAPGRRGRFASGAMASAPEGRTKWDLMLLSAAGLLLAFIWRLQDLYPILAKIQFPSLVFAGALLVFLLDHDPRRTLKSIKHPVTWLVVAILAWMVLSVPGSLYPGQSFRFLTNDHIKTFLMMVLVAAAIRTFQDVERLVRIMVLGAMLYAWYTLTRFQIGPGGRLSNLIYYDANDLGMVIVSTIPLALYFISRKPGGWMKWVALLGLVLFVLAVVRSGSRGGFLGLIAVAAYLLFGFGAIPKQTRILSVAGAFAMMLLVGSAQYWEMMGTLLNPQDDYNWAGGSSGGRTEIWKRGMGYMITHPVLGVGVDAFPVAEGSISPLAARQELGRPLKWSAAHNSFVQIGAELGVPGLAAFIFLLYYAYRTARGTGRTTGRSPPSDETAMGHALAGSLVGFAVAGFFLSQAYSAYLYAILAIIVGLAKVTAASSGAPAGGLTPRPTARRSAPPRGRPVPAFVAERG